ncbi:hypothetical protein MO973_33515 [Paenibacillus sp. TRM 82003]|nr:hypothetical protein [Paenibacillus sp. TRM 82003]
MRVPNLERSPSFMQRVGLVICGIVIGAAVMTGVSNQSIQMLQYDVQRLESEKNELVSQVESFEKVKNKRNVIDRTSVRWESAQKDFGKSTLETLKERIGADLLKLVGNPVHTELYATYREIINGKVYYDVNDKDYRVRITMFSVVGTECVVYVQAEEFIQD